MNEGTMIVETTLITNLTLDPDNARKHSPKNIRAISASLEKFGQRKPIVIHKGVVLAGNGTLEAAKALGWIEITTTKVPDNWDDVTAKAYALVDNQTSDLAEWDELVLAKQILELEEAGWDIDSLEFEAAINAMPDFQPEETDQPRLDQRTSTMCPQCSFEWRVGSKGEVVPT